MSAAESNETLAPPTFAPQEPGVGRLRDCSPALVRVARDLGQLDCADPATGGDYPTMDIPGTHRTTGGSSSNYRNTRDGDLPLPDDN